MIVSEFPEIPDFIFCNALEFSKIERNLTKGPNDVSRNS